MKKTLLTILISLCVVSLPVSAKSISGKAYVKIHWGGVGISYSLPTNQIWHEPATNYSISLGENDEGNRFITINAKDSTGKKLRCTQTEIQYSNESYVDSIFVRTWSFFQSWGEGKSFFVNERNGYCYMWQYNPRSI